MKALLLLAAALCCMGPACAGNDPASAPELLARAIVLARAADFASAERLLLEGRRLFPSDARFPRELAGVAFRKDDLSAARAFLRQALALDPSDTYANDFLGTLYLLDANLPAALKYWTRIQKPWIGSLRFDPPPPLAPLLRERNFEISAGQVFTYERLLRTESRLDLLGVFADTRFNLAPRQDGGSGAVGYDLTVRAIPFSQPLRGWPGYALSALSGLPYRELRPEFRNIGGRAVNLAALWRWDDDKRRLAAEISGPLHFWRYSVSVDARRENWNAGGDAFTLRRIEAGAALARDLTARLTWTLGVWTAARRFRGAAGPYFTNGWTAEMRNRLDYRLWDWPERRVRVDAWGLLRTGQFFAAGSSRLLGFESGWRGRWLPQAKGERYVVRAGSRTGAISGSAPFDELFMLGMERDNDLWLRGHVGTREGRKGSAPMGTRYLLTQAEIAHQVLQLPMIRLEAGPFFDTGRVGGAPPFGSQRWLYDTGVQVRIGTAGGLHFSAVYGRNLRDGSGVFYTAIRR